MGVAAQGGRWVEWGQRSTLPVPPPAVPSHPLVATRRRFHYQSLLLSSTAHPSGPSSHPTSPTTNSTARHSSPTANHTTLGTVLHSSPTAPRTAPSTASHSSPAGCPTVLAPNGARPLSWPPRSGRRTRATVEEMPQARLPLLSGVTTCRSGFQKLSLKFKYLLLRNLPFVTISIALVRARLSI